MPVQEIRFEYYGYPCVVLFMPMGYRCGYVGITRENKYYLKDYDDIPIDCHCGLTYADNRLFGQSDLDKWWIGFDCGHACDGYDIEKTKEYFEYNTATMNRLLMMQEYMELVNEDMPYRTLEFVIEECKKIVDQLRGEE